MHISNSRVLNGSVNADGYRKIGVDFATSRKMVSAHRFVYECWHGLIPFKMQIDHIDGKKLNNHISNLQALTPAEHRVKTLKQNAPLVMVNRRRAVIGCELATGIQTEYASAAVAAQLIPSIRHDCICACLCLRASTHKGYRFWYKENKLLPGEIWCSLYDPQYNRLRISSLGRLQYWDERVSSGYLHGDYLVTSVGGHRHRVHRLMCLAFYGPAPSADHTVDHIDRCKTNNTIDNLRWATKAEQMANRVFKKRYATLLSVHHSEIS